MSKPAKRSPIPEEEAALAFPGDSTYDRVLDEALKFFYFGMCGVILLCFAAAQWLDYLIPSRVPMHLLATFAAVVVVPVCAVISVKSFRRTKNAVLGLRGEKYVGERLERLRSMGYEVFHDLPGQPLAKPKRRWNIDHVIVGPAGVFAIETKTWRKFKDRDQRLEFDGEMLKLDGRPLPDRFKDPVCQSARNARRVAELLKSATARDFLVRSVLTFPGWFVTMTGGAWGGAVWVVNPKGLAKLLPQQPVTLSAEDIALVSDRLEVYLRDARQKMGA